MSKMHELLAVEADINNTALKLLEEGKTTFAGKPQHFQGAAKSTSFLDEKRKGEDASESREVVTTVDDKLNYVLQAVAKMYDLNLQKDATNQTAKADLVVAGVTLAKDVPSTFLLGMETKLKALRETLLAIPTLEPAVAWDQDPNKGAGIYRSPVVVTFKGEKKVEWVVMTPATDKFAAQIKDWTTDVAVARIETTHFSGMWSTKKKSEVLDRLDQLMYGVKQARQRANLADVIPVKIGDAINNFLLGVTK